MNTKEYQRQYRPLVNPGFTRAEYNIKRLNIGEVARVRLPSSEICMHMRIAGKLANVQLVSHTTVIVQVDDDPCSVNMLPSEAGLKHEVCSNQYYYEKGE